MACSGDCREAAGFQQHNLPVRPQPSVSRRESDDYAKGKCKSVPIARYSRFTPSDRPRHFGDRFVRREGRRRSGRQLYFGTLTYPGQSRVSASGLMLPNSFVCGLFVPRVDEKKLFPVDPIFDWSLHAPNSSEARGPGLGAADESTLRKIACQPELRSIKGGYGDWRRPQT